jgi:hypothetical protein
VRRGDVVASNWLQLQYGWLPLLKDVYDGAEFLAHHLSYPLQKVVRVHRRVKGTVANDYGYATFGGALCYTKLDIKAIIAEKDVVALSGLTDPLSVAWELLPYSFVIDWFIPVGNYLQARGLSNSLKGLFVVSIKEFASAKGLQGTNFEISEGDGYEWMKIHFRRLLYNDLEVPFPSFKPLGKVASWKHCANAVALLVSSFSGNRAFVKDAPLY